MNYSGQMSTRSAAQTETLNSFKLPAGLQVESPNSATDKRY